MPLALVPVESEEGQVVPKTIRAAEELTIVSERDGETADAVVCILWDAAKEYFTDNQRGTCVACLRSVAFRPSAPKNCMKCAEVSISVE